MADDTNHQPPHNETDRILAAVEKLVNKKIDADVACHREANGVHAKSAMGGYLAVAITLGVGASGIVADAYLKNRDRDEQILREANQRKLHIIAGISNAITAMRELKDVTLVSCGKDLSPNKRLRNKEERVKQGYELVKAARPMLHFFNDEFRKLVVSFLIWEESIPDYCDKNAPNEDEWLNKQKEIEQQMVSAPIESFIKTGN